MKIFWSRQNDIAPNVCRHFIRDALSTAIEQVGADLGLDEADRPELDHDTRGERGMVPIADTIRRKIKQSHVFVADLTPLLRTERGKALQNPNVLIELGWAMISLGEGKIIPVVNSAGGWTDIDLPFDIRHQRALFYELSEDANKKKKSLVKKSLVDDFKKAIKKNLEETLEEIADSAQFLEAETENGNLSIWAGGNRSLVYYNDSSPSQTHKATIKNCPRGYMRLVPYRWEQQPPRVSQIRELPDHLALYPMAKCQAYGDFGSTSNGFVRFHIWDQTIDKLPIIKDMVYFFEETGEFWLLDGTSIVEKEEVAYLDAQTLLKGWFHGMRSAFQLFDQFKAHQLRKVEIGLFGMEQVRLPNGSFDGSPPARKNHIRLDRRHRDWSYQERLQFLAEAYVEVLDMFGQSEPDFEEVLAGVETVLSSR